MGVWEGQVVGCAGGKALRGGCKCVSDEGMEYGRDRWWAVRRRKDVWWSCRCVWKREGVAEV